MEVTFHFGFFVHNMGLNIHKILPTIYMGVTLGVAFAHYIFISYEDFLVQVMIGQQFITWLL